MRSNHAKGLRAAHSLSVQDQPWWLVALTNHLDVAESKPLGPAGPKGLEASLLRRKARGESQKSVGPRIARRAFAVGEDSEDETVPMPTERVGQPGNLHHVDTKPNDHATSPTRPLGRKNRSR